MTGRRAAIVEGWPIFLTAVVVGIAFGLTARQSGLSIVETSATSVIVFAGAAQFVMLDLLRTGTPVPLIVLTVLLLNARHLLMAAAIRPFVQVASLPRRLGLAYVLTDEAFAMGIGWFRRGHRDLAYYAVFSTVLWCSWNVGRSSARYSARASRTRSASGSTSRSPPCSSRSSPSVFDIAPTSLSRWQQRSWRRRSVSRVRRRSRWSSLERSHR